MQSQEQKSKEEKEKEEKEKEERLIEKRKKKMKNPQDLMLLLPLLIPKQKKKKLKNYLEVDEKFFKEYNIKIEKKKERQRQEEKQKLQKMFSSLLFQVSIFTLFKRDWKLKIKLINKIFFSPFYQFQFITYKEVSKYEEGEEENQILDKITQLTCQALKQLNSGGVEELTNTVKQKISKSCGKYEYCWMFCQLNQDLKFPLNPIFKAIRLIRINFESYYKNSKQLLKNGTYQKNEVLNSLGFGMKKSDGQGLFVFKKFESKHKFSFEEVKNDQEKGKKIFLFQSILGNKVEAEEKNENKTIYKIENISSYFCPMLMKIMNQSLEYHSIRMYHKEQNFKNTSIVLRFLVTIHFYQENEDATPHQFIEAKQFEEFLRNIQKTILLDYLLSKIVKEYEEHACMDKTDNEDEEALAMRRIQFLNLGKIKEYLPLFEILKYF